MLGDRTHLGSANGRERSRMREQDAPRISEPLVKVDFPDRRFGDEIRNDLPHSSLGDGHVGVVVLIVLFHTRRPILRE